MFFLLSSTYLGNLVFTPHDVMIHDGMSFTSELWFVKCIAKFFPRCLGSPRVIN